MRITQIILSKQLGGAERHVADLSNHLARRHDVQVILRRPPPRYASLRHGGNIASLLRPEILVREAGRLFRDHRIGRLIREFRPDIIHTHLGDAGKSLRAIGPKAPLVATLHGEYKDKCYRAHDALICVSEWQRRTIPDSFRGKIETIPNFIPDRADPPKSSLRYLRRKFDIPDQNFVVGAIGRLAPEKGFDTLLQAFGRAGLGDASLLLVGDGPQRAELEALQSHGVVFAGWQEDPWPFYHLFDLFVMASRYEPFGIVVLEAMQAGTPVLSTRADGPAGILGDNTALLVDCDDVDGMAVALERLTPSPGLRRNLADAALEKVRNYSIDAVVPKIEAVYREMAERKPRI
jgi:glycosyltransferase involved in cell wall biosynthesis